MQWRKPWQRRSILKSHCRPPAILLRCRTGTCSLTGSTDGGWRGHEAAGEGCKGGCQGSWSLERRSGAWPRWWTGEGGQQWLVTPEGGGGYPSYVLERPYTVGVGVGCPPLDPPPPPPLPIFEADRQNLASAPSVPRGFTLQNFGPPSAVTMGGPWEEGGSQPPLHPWGTTPPFQVYASGWGS